MNSEEENAVEFMLLFLERTGTAKGGAEGSAAMKKFAGELATQGKLRRGSPGSSRTGIIALDPPYTSRSSGQDPHEESHRT